MSAFRLLFALALASPGLSMGASVLFGASCTEQELYGAYAAPNKSPMKLEILKGGSAQLREGSTSKSLQWEHDRESGNVFLHVDVETGNRLRALMGRRGSAGKAKAELFGLEAACSLGNVKLFLSRDDDLYFRRMTGK